MDELYILVLLLEHLWLVTMSLAFFLLQLLQSLFFAQSSKNIIVGNECHGFYNRGRKLGLINLDFKFHFGKWIFRMSSLKLGLSLVVVS